LPTIARRAKVGSGPDPAGYGWQAISSSIGVERYTPVAVRKDLPNRNTGRATLMLVQPSPRLRLGRQRRGYRG